MDYEHFTPPGMHFLKNCFVATLNKPIKKAVVVDGEVKVKKIARLNFWFDHRFADGADVQKHLPRLNEVLVNPKKYLE